MSIDNALDRLAEEDFSDWCGRLTGPRNLYRTEEPLPDENYAAETARFPATHDNATLVGSKLPNGNHMPVIDIDLPCELVESSTSGHFHLYINHEVSWEKYKAILRVLTDAGIVQVGFSRHTEERGQAFVRYPGVTKDNEAARIEETR